MALINKEPVYAKLLKGHNIILIALIVQLFELQLQCFFGLLKLLDGEIVSTVPLHIRDAVRDFLKLLFQNSPLTLDAHWDLFKLTVTDNNCVVIACGDAAAKAFAVFGFKVLFRCHQNISGGIEL